MQQKTVRRLKGGTVGLVPTLLEVIGWEYGAVLTGINIRHGANCWTAVVKADFLDRPYVAFINTADFASAVEVTSRAAAQGQLQWHPDDYPPKGSRHT